MNPPIEPNRVFIHKNILEGLVMNGPRSIAFKMFWQIEVGPPLPPGIEYRDGTLGGIYLADVAIISMHIYT